MLFFGITFAAGIVAVLAVQKLDIECLNPPASRSASSVARSVEVRVAERPKPFGALSKQARA